MQLINLHISYFLKGRHVVDLHVTLFYWVCNIIHHKLYPFWRVFVLTTVKLSVNLRLFAMDYVLCAVNQQQPYTISQTPTSSRVLYKNHVLTFTQEQKPSTPSILK
eukprot:m.50587 g.50587  ORF g.50587 m.50587 type:complete len:106 (+) comp21315_c0_seq3:1791-2108(+)